MTHKRSRKNVLIIDDDEWFCEYVVRLLAANNYEAKSAPNALAGMELLDGAAPDVVILDMFMPGPNGIVLLHEIASHNDLATIPIIVCTSNATNVPSGSLAPYGVRVLLDKTAMHPEDIVTAVHKVLV